MTIRDKTCRVMVGNVPIGSGAKIVVQSMTNVPMLKVRNKALLDVDRNLEQISDLTKIGCELVRVAIPNIDCIDAFEKIATNSKIPVIADIHFDYEIAIQACKRGACAIRINPGNIGSTQHVDEIIKAAKQANIPIRIGVNAGSLQDDIASMQDLTQPEKLVLSVERFVEHFEKQDFRDIVVSIKAHDVMTTVEACRLLAKRLPYIPQHLGITEAGTVKQGTIKSSVGLGILLSEGIGDTLRVSLTADPCEEIPVAYGILSALGLRRVKPELISCPTCSRCQVDLIPIAQEIDIKLKNLNKPIKVAVMGCVVNGPGEARDADCGVACGADCGVLFVHGERIKKVSSNEIIPELCKLIEEL